MTATVRILTIAVLTSAASASTIQAARTRQSPQPSTANPVTPPAPGPARGDALQITPATVDSLESEPDRHVGEEVFLDAHVADVLGPRLFTVADENFGATPALLVVVPERLAAGVRQRDHITLRGTVKRFDPAKYEGQWGWFTLDAAARQRFSGQIVLEASRIGGGEQVLMLAPTSQAPAVAAHEIPPSPAATSGKPDERTQVVLTDAARVATATEATLGRRVALHDLGVSGRSAAGGFLVNAGPGQVYVLPVPGTYSPELGDHVDLQGVLLRVWPVMRSSIGTTARTNGDVYVLATTVKKD
jgi:hypothetical protein